VFARGGGSAEVSEETMTDGAMSGWDMLPPGQRIRRPSLYGTGKQRGVNDSVVFLSITILVHRIAFVNATQ
jgi:hypothetical protein